MTTNGVSNGATHKSLTNYVAFIPDGSSLPRIGHLDLGSDEITPLSYASGTPLRSLYEVIEAGDQGIAPAGEPVPRSKVKLLAPISGRDVMAVGKNYAVRIPSLPCIC